MNAVKRIVEELDPLLHERGRLAIVSVLAAVKGLTFTELRDTLEMTDGNLSVHLQKLETKGYVAIDKHFVGRRPQTNCRLTKAGQHAFDRYLNHLAAIVEQGRGQAGVNKERGMQVRVADHLGMCFGVRDAIDLTLRLTRQGPITILGDLVHNADVVAAMESAGAVRAQRPEQVQTRAVLLTAHGTAKHVKLMLREEGRQVHDAACPLVKRVHLALRKLLADGRHPVIIGKADHVEVRGLVGDLEDCTLVEDKADLELLEGRPRLGVVAQTTQPLEHVQQLVAALRRRFPAADVEFIDTVCQPTKDRQAALVQLAAECDVVVVVGGPDSNNSRKLAETARQLGRPAYQVASAAELRREWFTDREVVGLTAGTSTPDRIIDEVRAWLEALEPDQPPSRRVEASSVSRCR